VPVTAAGALSPAAAPAAPPLAALARFYRGRPVLVYDRAALGRNLAEAARLRELGCRSLLAVKAFPHPEALRFAAEYLDGFDCSNRAEAALAPAGSLVSLTDPAGGAESFDDPRADVVVIDGVDQFEELERVARPRPYLVRLDLLDVFGFPNRPSKYGCALADLPRVCRSARHPFLGFHAHRQSLRRDDGEAILHETRFDRVELVRRILAFGFPVARINLGGGLFPAGLAAEIEAIRAFCPREIELFVEPGDHWFRGCGYAVSRVVKVQRRGDYRHLTTDISREAHLKWSNREGRTDRDLLAFAKEPANATVHGPSCRLNGEVLTTAHLPAADAPGRGDLLCWQNVSPYSFGWNLSFNGIPPAEVAFAAV
jgi:diaminopimelate decarboxylase